MKRIHLFEFGDLRWFPALWRDLATEYLQSTQSSGPLPRYVAERLGELLGRLDAKQIVDLCSGAGGPLAAVIRELEARGRTVTVTLTDRFPNRRALEGVCAQSGGAIQYRSNPIDAAAVPESLVGVRTLFSALHHFRPAAARAILCDAAQKRQGIGVFEFMDRRPLPLLFFALLIPIVVWLVTPSIRPFRWSRLLWTYLIPVVPLVVWWDGIVSALRIYDREELQELLNGSGATNFAWEIRVERIPGAPIRCTSLIGLPVAAGPAEIRA